MDHDDLIIYSLDTFTLLISLSTLLFTSSDGTVPTTVTEPSLMVTVKP